jgi:hypothetical protein
MMRLEEEMGRGNGERRRRGVWCDIYGLIKT